MKKTIVFLAIPAIIFLGLFNFIENAKDLLLIVLLTSTVIYWASNVIPDYQASLIFLFVCMLFSLSTKDIIFSGFASPAFWLVFAGMLIATSIKKVKISNQFGSFFSKIKNPTYGTLLIYISAFSLFFAFIMPSGFGRVVLLIPIASIVAKNYGFERTDKGHIGIVLTFILCTTLPGFSILPANAPNMIMAGLVSEIFKIDILYSHYLVINFLVLGLLKNIFVVSIIYFFFKDTIKNKDLIPEQKEKTKEQKIVIFTLLIMMAFWFTDFIHGINPSIIAIAGVLFLAYPKIGILDTKDINSLNISSLIFLAGIIGLGSVTANNQFTKEVLSWSIHHLEVFDSKLLNYLTLTSFISFSGIVLTQATIPAVYTPIANELSSVSGFSINEIFMMQVMAFSTVFFPYQMAPLIIGAKLAEIKQREMLKVLLTLAIFTLIFLMPLQFLWMDFLS